MYTLKTEQMTVPLRIWSEEGSIEPQCLEQMERVSSLPFLHKHVSLMPDAHFGVGASIGAVVPTKGVVIPFLVGVDIGCGVCAVKTSLTEISTDTLKKIMGEIRKAVPVGFKKHKEGQDRALMPKSPCVDFRMIIEKEYENALKSLGTLGGGNHFIEIQRGDDGHIWIMIHSGSRNLGLQVAKFYNDMAKSLNGEWCSKVDPKWDLAFLPLNNSVGQAYIREMNYCVEYALANRSLMMHRISCIFEGHFPDILFADMYNIAHNYARLESHFGENVMVHRKGATSAKEGEIGIIPGSMGSHSYIVKGKGNKESFESCSHGAGRLMSRKKCKETLDLSSEQKLLDDMGVIHGLRSVGDLDEAPSAYKDVHVVMENQKDLVEVLVKLTPLCVIKG